MDTDKSWRVPGELRWYGKRLDTELKQVRLIIISDVHIGNPLFSPKHFERTLNFIKDHDDVYCALNGDLLETALKSSKGDVYRQTLPPRAQRDNMIDLLKPIKDKILGMTTGNHEWRLVDNDSDFSEDISKELGVPYRPEGMVLRILFGKGNNSHADKPYVFEGYMTHGYGGARTKAAKSVKVERLAAYVHCDFYAMSHDHDVSFAPHLSLEVDVRGKPHPKYPTYISGLVRAKRAALIKTNAYIKWGGYSEMGGFAPVDLTTPVIWLLSPESKYWDEVPDRHQKGIRVIS